MKAAGENLLHVSVVPGGHFPPPFQAGLCCLMAANEIDRDLSERGEVLDSFPIPDPAVIFIEDDVHHPVEAVLDLPMPADRFRQNFWLVGTAGQEVADVGFGLAGPVDAADGLHGQNGFETWPIAERFQRRGIWADEHAAPDPSLRPPTHRSPKHVPSHYFGTSQPFVVSAFG